MSEEKEDNGAGVNGHWARWTPWGALLACISKIINNKRGIVEQEVAVVDGATVYRIDCGEAFWVLARDPYQAFEELRRNLRDVMEYDHDEIEAAIGSDAKCRALTKEEAMDTMIQDAYGARPLMHVAIEEGSPAVLGSSLW